MDKEKKKKPEEEVPKPEEEVPKPEEKPTEEQKPDEKPDAETPKHEEKTEEKLEKKSEDNSSEESKPEDTPLAEVEPEAEEKSMEEAPPEAPDLSEADTLKAENLRLKTQLEALKLGFAPENLDDAVILAEEIVKRDGGEISKALQTVAKKYPDWKSGSNKDGNSKGGFKVGADSNPTQKKETTGKNSGNAKRWNRCK